MCIICIKPTNTEMPSKRTIQTMWNRNPDGAGFMFPKDGKVHIEKGFMELDDFMDALQEANIENDFKALPLVMHFRISTHGGVIPGNTHPFPISKSVQRMHSLTNDCEYAVAHNGIISITPQRKDISDTMEYIRSVINPIKCEYSDWMFDQNILDFIEGSINYSRMVFMNGEGQMSTVGKWHFDWLTGLYYSNLNYITSKAKGGMLV